VSRTTISLASLTVLAVLVHIVAGLWAHDLGTAVVLLCVNLFALAAGAAYARSLPQRRVLLYVGGYAALFLLVAVIAREPLLFAIFGLLYAAVFRSTHLLGYLVILVLSLLLVPMYWFQTLVLAGMLYAVVLQVYRQREKRLAVVYFAVGFALLVAVLLPILYLALQSSPQTLLVTAGQGGFVAALGNSFLTATISTLIVLVFGVPFAYAMARLEFRGKEIINSLIDLPILIPQSVVGIGLLVLLGPKAPLGELLREHLSLSVSGSYLGIIACQVFVSCPFLIRGSMDAFEEISPKLENASRTLGATQLATFFRLSLPLASGAIFNGCILTWARAISETGSLMVVAYRPTTISIYTFDTFTQYGLEEARPAAILLLIVCLWAFIVLRWVRTGPLGSRRLAGQMTAS
jgi:molybdate/tungstate transport system permease protein